MFLRSIIMSGALFFALSPALAQENAVEKRIDLMKQAGAATKNLADMLKGTQPFDLKAAQDSFTVHATVSKDAEKFFTEDSKGEEKSTASPKIWETNADFKAKFSQWAELSDTAIKTTTDEASFKKNAQPLLGACKGCHDLYRVQK